jgi:hypothetical protein
MYSNNKTGVRGVDFRGGKYRARIQVESKSVHLGAFATLELAEEAYKQASKELRGVFSDNE